MLVTILQAALALIANHCLAGGTWSEYSWGGWAGSYLVGLCALVGFARRRWLVPPVVFGCGILFVAITLRHRPFLHPCIRRALPWAAALQVAVFSLAFTTAAWTRSRSAFALAMVGTFLCSSLVVPLIPKETITPKAKYELPMRATIATIVEVDARGDRALLETGCLVGDLRVWHRDGWLDIPDERFAYDCLLGCRFRESEVRLVCRRFDTEICESCHLAVVDWDGTSWMERLNMELPLSQVAVAGQGNVLSPDGDLIVLNGGRWVDLQSNELREGEVPAAFGPDTRFLQWCSEAKQAAFYSQDTNEILFWAPRQGDSTTNALKMRPLAKHPISVSPDGRRLVYFVDEGRKAICEDLSAGRIREYDLAGAIIPGCFGVLPPSRVLWQSGHEVVFNMLGALAVLDITRCRITRITPPMHGAYDLWCSQSSGRLAWIADRGDRWQLSFR